MHQVSIHHIHYQSKLNTTTKSDCRRAWPVANRERDDDEWRRCNCPSWCPTSGCLHFPIQNSSKLDFWIGAVPCPLASHRIHRDIVNLIGVRHRFGPACSPRADQTRHGPTKVSGVTYNPNPDQFRKDPRSRKITHNGRPPTKISKPPKIRERNLTRGGTESVTDDLSKFRTGTRFYDCPSIYFTIFFVSFALSLSVR